MSAKNDHAMRVAGKFDDGDGVINDAEWTKYQQSLGNTWSKEGGWTNGGQPQNNGAQPQSNQSEQEQRSNNQRMAGEKIAAGGLEKFKNDANKVDTLGGYDFRAHGAGGSAGRGSSGLTDRDMANDIYGKGANKMSKYDVRQLADKFGAKALKDFYEANEGVNGFRAGGGAKRMIENLIAESANTPPPAPAPSSPPPPPPAQPRPSNPEPSRPAPTPTPVRPPNDPVRPVDGIVIGGDTVDMGDNTQIFENIGGDITDSFNDNSGSIEINNGVGNAEINDNSRFYGGDKSAFYYNGGGNGAKSSFDDGIKAPTEYDNPYSQDFLSRWKEKFLNRRQFGGD